MTAARIIEAVGSLLWPLLVAVIAFRLAPHLPGVVADLRQGLRTRAFKVKVGAVELSVEEATEQLRRQVSDLQTQMAAQLVERGAGGAPPDATGTPPGTFGPRPGAAGEPAVARAQAPGLGRPTVLWVDDRPEANVLEIAKLRDDGVEVLQARSTAEAMDVLSLRRGVHAIVTDLGRTEDGEYRSHAGLALLRQVREAELEQPVLVYTSTRGVEQGRQDAIEAGAAIVTASPTELFAALLTALAAPAGPEAPDRSVAGQPQPPASHRPRRRPARPGPS